MLIVTSETVAGHRIVKTLGLVRGNTIRARHIGKDIMAGLRNIVGGEVHEYAKLIAEAREQTLDRIGVERQGMVREIFRNLVTAEGTRASIDREQLLSVFLEPDEAFGAFLRGAPRGRVARGQRDLAQEHPQPGFGLDLQDGERPS